MGIDVDLDFLLVQKMRLGDEQAFDHFISKYYPAILNYCRLHIPDNGYAEDMTQETFTHFFRTLKQYRHYGKAANYLYTIASNVCKDYYKKKKEILTENLPEVIDENTQNMENKIMISEAFSNLSDELKEVAILYFIQGHKQNDIAVILQISIPLVKYRIRKARELLSAYFREEHL